MKKLFVIFTFLIIMTSCFNKQAENKTYGVEQTGGSGTGGGGGSPYTETGGR